jgi:PBP1b-binding outer membrane lipoprotein LpoB
MTLTNAKTGDSVWEDQTPITKIGSHASVGM